MSKYHWVCVMCCIVGQIEGILAANIDNLSFSMFAGIALGYFAVKAGNYILAEIEKDKRGNKP